MRIPAPPTAPPVVAGASLVLPLRTGAVAAYSLADGQALWTTEIAAEHPLAGDAERVYVASGEAVHALDARTGEVAWRVAVGGAPTAPPLAHAGWVVVPAAGQLLAIRAADGAVIWRLEVGPVEYRSAIDGDLLAVPLVDGRLVAIDLPSGTERWHVNLGTGPLEPLVLGGRVYVGTRGKTFFSLHASSGREDFRWNIGATVQGRAAADERHVYIAARDNVVRAFDRGHGARRWAQGLDYRPAIGPVVLDGRIVVPGRDVSVLPAFDAVTGAPAGQVGFPELLATLPLFAETPSGDPVAVAITGSLANEWSLSILEPSPVPPLPVQPFTELPGTAGLLPVSPFAAPPAGTL